MTSIEHSSESKNKSNREMFLNTYGYEEPFDDSPIATPEGWFGGEVRGMGGGTYCRVWTSDPNLQTKEGQYQYRVIYNVKQSAKVDLERFKWSSNKECYRREELITSKDAVHHTDQKQAEAALRLMEFCNELCRPYE